MCQAMGSVCLRKLVPVWVYHIQFMMAWFHTAYKINTYGHFRQELHEHPAGLTWPRQDLNDKSVLVCLWTDEYWTKQAAASFQTGEKILTWNSAQTVPTCTGIDLAWRSFFTSHIKEYTGLSCEKQRELKWTCIHYKSHTRIMWTAPNSLSSILKWWLLQIVYLSQIWYMEHHW